MQNDSKFLERELQYTADGSHTLFIPSMNEHYHSINGAIQEAEHVYIKAGLQQLNLPELAIVEIGFGTGLNAFLTLIEAEKKKIHIKYHTFEYYPLPKEITDVLNYSDKIGPEYQQYFTNLHNASWGKEVQLTSYFTLHKIKGDVNQLEIPPTINLIYFDAFAPEKQPEMWNQNLFNRLYAALTSGGILTTYCAKGSVRRSLQAAGFHVERIPGPPGKREILRAQK